VKRVIKVMVNVELGDRSRFHPGAGIIPQTEAQQLARLVEGYTQSLVEWATLGPVPHVTVTAEEVKEP